MSRWDKFAAHNDRWGRPAKKDARASWRIVTAMAWAMGNKMKYNSAEEVFREIAEKVSAFKGLSYLKIGRGGALLKNIQVGVPVS